MSTSLNTLNILNSINFLNTLYILNDINFLKPFVGIMVLNLNYVYAYKISKINTYFQIIKIDLLIDFRGMSTHQGSFYASR